MKNFSWKFYQKRNFLNPERDLSYCTISCLSGLRCPRLIIPLTVLFLNQKNSFLDFWNNTKTYIYSWRNLESVHYLINFWKIICHLAYIWDLRLKIVFFIRDRPELSNRPISWHLFWKKNNMIICLDFANGHKRQLILLLSCLSFEHFFLKCFFYSYDTI